MNSRNLTRGLAAGKGESLPSLISSASEETLVLDLRSGLTMAQLIEHRLLSLLWVTPLPAEPRRKFKPAAVGQIAQGVTRFEVVASITALAKQADHLTPACSPGAVRKAPRPQRMDDHE